MRTVATPGNETDLIRLDLARLADGESLATTPAGEVLAVVLSGKVAVRVDSVDLGVAGGRRSVFEGPGDAVYAPPASDLRLSAVEGAAELALASAPLDGAQPGRARVIRPGDQRVAEVGRGNWSRSVRTILGPEHEAGRLLVGETVNPAGNWSSYPPHKHDRHDPPREVQLEEVYFFKVDPVGGFGIQVLYDDEGEQTAIVRNDDVVGIKSGYHPVVAAPGYSLYYLWVMAGRGREMIPFLDPRHAWVQQEQA